MKIENIRDKLELGLLEIDELKIRKLSGAEYYRRGLEYFSSGAVREAVLHIPNKITSKVIGNYRPYYKVEIEAEGCDLDWWCTCPVGGFCKHIIATLLMWIKKPSEFKIRFSNEEKKREYIGNKGEYKIKKEQISRLLNKLDKKIIIEKILELIDQLELNTKFCQIIEFLNYPKELKKEVKNYKEFLKRKVVEELLNIKNSYKELNTLYEDGYDPYHYNNEWENEIESELNNSISDSVRNLKEILLFLKILFRYKLINEARELYEYVKWKIEEILILDDNFKLELLEGHSEVCDRDFDMNKKMEWNQGYEVLEEFKDEDDYKFDKDIDDYEFDEDIDEDEFNEDIEDYEFDEDIDEDEFDEDIGEDEFDEEDYEDFEYISMTELENYYLELKDTFFILDQKVSVSHSEYVEKLIYELENRGFKSEIIREELMEEFNGNDVEIIKKILAKTKKEKKFDKYFKLATELMGTKYKKELINLCEMFLETRNNQRMYEWIIKLLIDKDQEKAMMYCEEAIKRKYRTDFILESIYKLSKASENKEKALEAIFELYIWTLSDKNYRELKNYSKKIGKWNDIKDLIYKKLKKRNDYNNLINFLIKENMFKEIVEVIKGRNVYSILLLKAGNKAVKNKNFEEAIIIYKKYIKGLLYPGSGITQRLEDALEIAQKMQKIYKDIGKEDEFIAYIESLKKEYKNLWGFKSNFINYFLKNA